MRISLQVISLLALIMTVVPSVLFLAGSVELDRVKLIMLVSTVVWFAVTPFWMNKKEKGTGGTNCKTRDSIHDEVLE